MIYLESFNIASELDEGDFVLNYPYRLEMRCYSHENIYPFGLFPKKKLENITFEPITFFYGKNGSGKSTLINIRSEKIGIDSSGTFNTSPYMISYLKYCSCKINGKDGKLPTKSMKITSDDVFDFLFDMRGINRYNEEKREALFEEYNNAVKTEHRNLRSLADIDDFRRVHEAKNTTKSKYVTKRLGSYEIAGKSNGESAFSYFTDKIRENALYILDEPENSLSPKLAADLAAFIEDSARFYNCQFIISTHSPFLLSVKGAKIYDLDSQPVQVKKWSELENVRFYYDFFKAREDAFE